MSKKAILAFSGGLDTSVAVKYLLQEYGLETITVTVDVGQQDDYRKVAAKSKKLGALKHITRVKTLIKNLNLWQI